MSPEINEDDWTTSLVPVKEWIFNRYKVTFKKELYYFDTILYLVETDSHRDHAINEKCGDLNMQRWEWELIEENVSRPKQIGELYGCRIDSDGWSKR